MANNEHMLIKSKGGIFTKKIDGVKSLAVIVIGFLLYTNIGTSKVRFLFIKNIRIGKADKREMKEKFRF